ncbi:MAG: hypothetical protein FGF53_10405, partial [Candidatus Brockarchaeota archaeon]|nr:hypothetical protein [Candidatus Brockarchaeota archaeon]
LLLMFFALLNVYVGYTPGIQSLIAGSLIAILGYQLLFFGVFARVLQHRSLPRFLTLECCSTLGGLAFSAGLIWVLKVLLDWVGSGFSALPPVEHSVLCFTLIALGLQTFFSSFMLSIIAEHRRRLEL